MFENIVMWVFKVGCLLFIAGLCLMAIGGAIAIVMEVFS